MQWSRSELENFFLLPPPRRGDPAVEQAILDLYLPRIGRILMASVALVCFMSALLCVVLAMRLGYGNEWRMLADPTASGRGTVIGVEAITGSKGSITYRYAFEFMPPGSAAPVKGFCFSSRPAGERGAAADIEYVASKPAIARMKGTHLNPVPLPVFLLIPLNFLIMIGLLYGIFAYRKRWAGLLVREGVLVQAAVREIKRGAKAQRILLSYDLNGESRSATLQLFLRKPQLELLARLRNEARKVAAIANPVRRKQVLILDLICSETHGRTGVQDQPFSERRPL